jgi:hypothetical protein
MQFRIFDSQWQRQLKQKGLVFMLMNDFIALLSNNSLIKLLLLAVVLDTILGVGRAISLLG